MDSGPATAVTDGEVRAQLSVLVRSRAFAHAPSLSRLLTHLVERTLDGRTADLKEYSLGVDVFDRGEAFDPKVDTIVRAQARRLRAKLAEYYDGDGRNDAVVIEVAKGRYVPAFARRSPSPPSPPGRRARLIGVAAVAGVAIFALATGASWWRGDAHGPVTLSSEYEPITDFADSATAPALSADGRFVAFIRGGEAFLSRGQVYVKALPDGDAVRLTLSDSPKFAPAFTPDGSRVAYSLVVRTPAGASWDTYAVPIHGGVPARLLANATGLGWVDPRHMLFSAFRGNNHLGIVTAGDGGVEERAVYFPAHDRGMAHYSYLSPDRVSVLVVEMAGDGTFQSCRLVPFDGRSAGRMVGPAGSCRSAAWSPDGAWMYFGAVVGGESHLWRQAFPDGTPEQITFGPTEEEGVAVAPDGRWLMTAIGRRRSEIWMHREDGDRPLSSDGFAYAPHLSGDGRRVYYLMRESPAATTSELRSIDLASGQSRRLLAGLPFTGKPAHAGGLDYDVSRDGQQVVYAARGPDGVSTVWLARLDQRTSPRELASGGALASFGPQGDVFFVAVSGETSSLARIRTDGSGLERIGDVSPVYDRSGVSPDGKWAVVFSGAGSGGNMRGTVAVPVSGGAPRRICGGLCWASWSTDGRFFFVTGFDEPNTRGTLVIPLAPGVMLPDLPVDGLNAPTNVTGIPGVRVIPRGVVFPAPDASTYLYVKTDVLRNLYRVPLH